MKNDIMVTQSRLSGKKGFICGCEFTSESIRWASVAIDHAPGISRSTTRHASTVVEGLRLPAETRALLWRLLMASWLVLGMEGTNY